VDGKTLLVATRRDPFNKKKQGRRNRVILSSRIKHKEAKDHPALASAYGQNELEGDREKKTIFLAVRGRKSNSWKTDPCFTGKANRNRGGEASK